MLLRLRSRDGLERVEVADGATVGGLKATIHEKLNIPLQDMRLSKNPGLLTSKTPQVGWSPHACLHLSWAWVRATRRKAIVCFGEVCVFAGFAMREQAHRPC